MGEILSLKERKDTLVSPEKNSKRHFGCSDFLNRGRCFAANLKAFTTILFWWILAQTFYFGSYGPDLGFVNDIRPHRVLFILLVVTFLAARMGRRTVSRPIEWPERLLLLLMLISGVSFVLSGAHYDSTVAQNKWLSALFNITVFPYMTYFFVRAFSYQREFAVKLIKLICFLGIYLGITAFLEHYELTSLVWPSYIMDESRGTQFGRARGPFMESVAMGRVLTMAFAGWLLLRLEGSTRLKKLALFCLPLTLAGVYFTNTRGPWIGLGLVFVAFLFIRTPARQIVVRLTFCVLVAATIGLSNKFSLGGKNLFLDRQSTVTDRVVTWLVSGEMIKAHPLAGIGFGRFNLEWDNYYRDFQGFEFMGFDGSHNTFLTMAAELGLPTLAVYLTMVVLMIRRSFRVYRSLSPDRTFERTFVVMVIGLFWMYLFTGWFSDLRWNTVQNTLMFLLLGIVSTLEFDACRTAAESETSSEVPEVMPEPNPA